VPCMIGFCIGAYPQLGTPRLITYCCPGATPFRDTGSADDPEPFQTVEDQVKTKLE